MRRIISAFLCLALILFLAVSPIRANAYVFDPVSSTAYAVVGDLVVETFSDGAKLIASALVSASNTVTNWVSDSFLVDCYNIATAFWSKNPDSFEEAYNSFAKLSISSAINSKMILDAEFCDGLQEAVEDVGEDQIVVPEAGTEIYVPPDSIWTQAEMLTYDRLVYEGFSDLETLNESVIAGNQISWQTLQKIMSLSAYLRTDFVDDLADKFSSLSLNFTADLGSLSSDIDSYIDTLRIAVNLVTTTLSGKLDTLKSTLSTDLGQIKNAIGTLGTSIFDQLVDINSNLKIINSTLENLSITVPDVVFDLSPLTSAITKLQTTLSADILVLRNTLSTDLAQIKLAVTNAGETLSDDLATLNASIVTLNGNLNTWDRTTIDRVMENLQQVKEYQVNARDVIVENLQQIKEYQVLVYNRIHTEVQGVKDGLAALQKNVVYRLTLVETAINGLGTKLDGLSAAITDYVAVTVPESVQVTTKPQVQVTVGAQTYLVQDYASASDAFYAKFSFVTDIFDFLRELFDRISAQNEPPKIMLNLSRTEGSYDIGEDTVMVDFSWYERFKPTVDVFLSGLIWIVFAWNVYKKLPGILSGFELSQDGGVPTYGYYGGSNELRLSGSKALPSGRRND